MKTLNELKEEAKVVQNACNILGVSKGFARALDDLRALGLSLDDISNHSVTVAWIDKLCSLAHIQFSEDKISQAFSDLYIKEEE